MAVYKVERKSKVIQYVQITSLSVGQIAMNILNSGRFSMGSSSAGMIKKLIGKCSAQQLRFRARLL